MARSALLKADTEDLKELLSNGKGYSVPLYQRDYSWKQEHWEDLWEDLMTIKANQEDHYMGALVLESGERKHYRKSTSDCIPHTARRKCLYTNGGGIFHSGYAPVCLLCCGCLCTGTCYPRRVATTYH